MTPLAMIRHGPTAWNEEHRLQGRADVPLSAVGVARVETWVVPDEFRAFTFGNAVSLYAGANPDFFEGTTITDAAQKERATS